MGRQDCLFERTASASAPYRADSGADGGSERVYRRWRGGRSMQFEELLNWDATAAEMVRLFSEKLAEG